MGYRTTKDLQGGGYYYEYDGYRTLMHNQNRKETSASENPQYLRR
jgi:hypothetical protein